MRALVEILARGRQRSAISRRDPTRCQRLARVGRHAQGGKMSGPYLIGLRTALGLAAAVITCALDQAAKLWLIFWFELGKRGSYELGPFVDLVLTWNTGISY